jgi:hypothetical protein
MNITTKGALRTAVAFAAGALMIHSGWAQGLADREIAQAGDPARWYQEDTTPRAHFQTSQKEAGAAYQEALRDCKREDRVARSERTACLHNAATHFDEAMADARLRMRAPRR